MKRWIPGHVTDQPTLTRRAHGAVVGPPARRAIERAGWRTRLEYHESRRRTTDGQLVAVEECWTAEAQRFEGEMISAQVTAESANVAWEALLGRIERGEVTHHTRVRFA